MNLLHFTANSCNVMDSFMDAYLGMGLSNQISGENPTSKDFLYVKSL